MGIRAFNNEKITIGISQNNVLITYIKKEKIQIIIDGKKFNITLLYIAPNNK